MLIATIFAVLVVALLAHDLYQHRDDEVISLASAAKWSVFYLCSALAFAGFLAFVRGPATASLFMTAYVLEQALSVDNLLVFGVVFAYFGVTDRYQHKTLYYGILGAIIFRLLFVVIGASALAWFGRPVEFVFALFVGWSALQVIRGGDDDGEIDHEGRWYVRIVRRIWPLDSKVISTFFVGNCVTRLLLCLVSIEITDVMFAFDSVPVVIAVARDPLIIYSAMIFAIMGLRSMYFVLSALQRLLVHLNKAVGVILLFVTAKLLASSLFEYQLDPYVSLGIVVLILGIGIGASLLNPTRKMTGMPSS